MQSPVVDDVGNTKYVKHGFCHHKVKPLIHNSQQLNITLECAVFMACLQGALIKFSTFLEGAAEMSTNILFIRILK